MITILMIFGAICIIWVFSKLIRANSYNQMNYNTYRNGNRNDYQDNLLKELFEELTLQQRYALMMIYLYILSMDSTRRIYRNIDAIRIVDRAYRLLRVDRKMNYMNTMNLEEFPSILSSIQNSTIKECLLVDYLELSRFLEKREDRLKAIDAIVNLYAMMGYTVEDIKNVMEKVKVLMNEFYDR